MKRRERITSFLFFTLLAVVQTWPIASKLTTSLAGDGGDASLFVWNSWWFRYSILELHQWPFTTNHIFHPLGASLLLHTFTPLYNVLTLPAQYFLTPITLYNILILVTYCFSGWGVYLFLRSVGLSVPAAAFAGWAFASSPVRMIRNLGHLNLLSTQWFACLMALLVSLRGTRHVKRRIWAVAGIVLASTFCSYQVTVVMILLIPFIVFTSKDAPTSLIPDSLNQAILLPRSNSPTGTSFHDSQLYRKFGLLLLIGICIMVVHLPFLTALFLDNSAMGSLQSRSGLPERYSTDVAFYFLPAVHNTVLGPMIQQLHPYFWKGTENVLSPGMVVAFLTLLSLFFVRRLGGTWPWFHGILGFTALCFLLSLGSRLLVFRHQTDIPLPFLFFRELPFINGLNIPNRFALGVAFGSALCAGLTVDLILSRLSLIRRTFILMLFVFMIIETTVIPLPMQDYELDIPGLSDGNGPLLNIPFGLDDSWERIGFNVSHLSMLQQTLHHRPMISGHASRLPPDTINYFREDPFLRHLDHLQHGLPGEISSTELSEARQASFLLIADIRDIIVHRTYLKPADFTAIVQFLHDVLPDAEVAVYPNHWIFHRRDQSPASSTIDLRQKGNSSYAVGAFIRDQNEIPVFFHPTEFLLPVLSGFPATVSLSLQTHMPPTATRMVIDFRVDNVTMKTIRSDNDQDLDVTIPIPEDLASSPTRLTVIPRCIFDNQAQLVDNAGLAEVLSEIVLVSAGYNHHKLGGYSRIEINGRDYSPNSRGLNVVVFDPQARSIVSSDVFDVCESVLESDGFTETLERIPTGFVVMISIKDDGTANLSVAARDALKSIGCLEGPRDLFRSAYVALGMKGMQPGMALERSDPTTTYLLHNLCSCSIDTIHWKSDLPMGSTPRDQDYPRQP